ncbi:hypothetical protein M413DRAFT_278594 [Hebeloma cylindrosporum]|uniref:Peptidase A1 domain-containing protein n=1 Tax=Hebeloma cylindrosporum TaxID=76867 RepID=A0A0C3BKC3_HEBCY|nr:hypothetical protein M413DRAFT_278594 [Hebeloma cylindrosporum h7]
MCTFPLNFFLFQLTHTTAAANNVQSEPLGPKFSGILGIALPLNSIIASTIPPVTNNNPDGAAWASNLFSITPIDHAPASRFLSLALSRPGSDRVSSALGIGRHPAELVPDPDLIRYSSLVSERSGTLFWKVGVRAITVYVNGEARKVEVGRSNTGAVFPSAVLDSGVPLILTTSTIANAIYGAIGVNPSSDGTYYVPCKTPLNMTMTLDDRPEIPLHPLDLTAEPPTDPTAPFCIGLIQSADPQLSRPDSSIGDMILGVPFMRNVYPVMAYTTPNSDGSFPLVASDNQTDGGLSQLIRPRLGLLPLTDPTTALKEFNTVRVLNQPISSSSPANNTGSNGNTKTVDVGGKHLSIGILVLIGLLSFFGLCCILFSIRWFIVRRSYRHKSRNAPPDDDDDNGLVMDKKSAYRLARRNSAGVIATGDLSEDQLREMRYQAFLKKEKRILSDGTTDSDRTLAVDQEFRTSGGYAGKAKQNVEEFGVVRWNDSESGHGHPQPEENDDDEVWDPRTAGLPWKDSTLVGNGRHPTASDSITAATRIPLVADPSPPSSPEPARFPHHRPTYSDPEPAHPHRQTPSVDIPLLLSQQHPDDEYRDNPTVPAPLHHSHAHKQSSSTDHDYARDDDLAEFGLMNGVSMAGVGSAALRTSRIGAAAAAAYRLDSPTFNRDSMMSATLEDGAAPHDHPSVFSLPANAQRP